MKRKSFCVAIVLFFYIAMNVTGTHAMPLYTCHSTCDGFDPPPIASCGNDSSKVETYQLSFESDGDNAFLYLYSSGNCDSLWAAVYYAGTDNDHQVTVNALGVWEASSGGGGSQCDGSNQGALDTLPHTLTTSNRWESTHMNGADESWCSGGANFHGATDVTIDGLDSGCCLNTDTWYQ
jgi:hypothetical protein